MVKVREDMTNQIFGRLRVLEQAEDYIDKNGRHFAQWKCECSCEPGKIVIKRGDLLKNGHTQSCGCIHKEIMTDICKTKKKYNDYDLSGEYGIGWTSNTNKEFYFDLEDYDKIKDYCWYEHEYGYLHTNDPISKQNIKMHQLIFGKYPDHINRNRLDNRKSNLRSATSTENTQNRSKFKNNTSNVTGVTFQQEDEIWIASIGVNKKRIYLGCFANKEDAIIARLRAEIKYFGDFAPQKHLFKQYGINTQQNDLDKENQTNDRTN